MARPRTNITLPYIYRKQPMPMAGRCKTSVGTLTESLVYRLINEFYRQEWEKVSSPT